VSAVENLGPWEKMTVLKNSDGSYSFQNSVGSYLGSVSGSGNPKVAANLGPWEKWNLYPILEGGFCI